MEQLGKNPVSLQGKKNRAFSLVSGDVGEKALIYE